MPDAAAFDLDNPVLPRSVREAALASGGYPYDKRMNKDEYELQLDRLYRQLALLQAEQARRALRIVLILEGRDAAGKGGTIKTYLKHLNPRLNYDVALPKPTDRERTQWYFQRYVDWLPAGGEQVLFDRSWYNRAGVEPVMGFCTPEQTEAFLREVPQFERMLVNDGIILVKFWLSIGKEMQLKRFHARRHNPLKAWKLSPVDLEALARFDAYSEARDRMLEASHSVHAPWTIVFNNDKRRGRLAVLQTVLSRIDYEGKDPGQIGAMDASIAMPADRFLAGHAGA